MDLRPTLASILLLACGFDHPPTTFLPAETPVAAADARPLGRDEVSSDIPLPIVAHNGHRWVVLAPLSGDGDPGAGPTRLISRDDVVVTERAARPEAVPARWRETPQTLRLESPRGGACTVRLGTPVVLARVVPNQMLDNAWHGRDDDDRQGPVPSDAEIVDAAYQEGADGRSLAVEILDGGCAEATWGHAGTHAPQSFVRGDVGSALARAAVAAYRETDAWREVQGLFRETPEDADGRPIAADARWDEHRGNAPEVRVYRHPSNGRSFVTVRGLVPFEGCGVFSGSVWAVYEVVGHRLVSRGATTAGNFDPLEVFDVDGDGAPEFVGDAQIRALGPSGYEVTADTTYPVHLCPC